MPAKKPMKTTSSSAIHSVNVHDMSSTIDAGADDGDAEDPLAGEVAGDARAERDAEPEADEDRAEEQAVGGVTAAEGVRERLAGRDDHAGRGHGAGDPDDQAAHQRGVAGEGEAVLQRAEEGLLRLDRARRPRRPLIEGRFQMTTAATRKVSAFRYSARSTSSTPGMTSDSRPPTLVSTANTIGGEHGREPVGGDEGELVGRLQLVLAQHVRDGGLLGRDPEQA